MFQQKTKIANEAHKILRFFNIFKKTHELHKKFNASILILL